MAVTSLQGPEAGSGRDEGKKDGQAPQRVGCRACHAGYRKRVVKSAKAYNRKGKAKGR